MTNWMTCSSVSSTDVYSVKVALMLLMLNWQIRAEARHPVSKVHDHNSDK